METDTILAGGIAPDTKVTTPAGPRPAGTLAAGDWITHPAGGGARIAAVTWSIAPAVTLPTPLRLAADQPVRRDGADLPAAWLPDAGPPEPALLVRFALDAPGSLLAAGIPLAPAGGPAPLSTLLAAVDRLRAARA